MEMMQTGNVNLLFVEQWRLPAQVPARSGNKKGKSTLAEASVFVPEPAIDRAGSLSNSETQQPGPFHLFSIACMPGSLHLTLSSELLLGFFCRGPQSPYMPSKCGLWRCL